MKIQNIARLGGNLDGCDCADILQRLTQLEENQWDCAKTETCLEQRLTNIKNELTQIHTELANLEQFVMISEVSNYMAPVSVTLPIRGIGVSVISVGNTYNMWGTGALTTGANISLLGGNTYYIIKAGQPSDPDAPVKDKIFELTWYVGDPTIGTLWIKDDNHTGGSVFYSLPLQFNENGIYFTVPSGNINNLTPGTTFRFTQALILTP